MADIQQRRNDVADRIVQAFAGLPDVQRLIPEGHTLHVKAVWDPQDQDATGNLLPYALLLEVKPIDDVPIRHLPRCLERLVQSSAFPGETRPRLRYQKRELIMFNHNAGWSITPADDCDAIECCADESVVVVEVWDGEALAHRGQVEITALDVMINCAKHYRPADLVSRVN